MAPMRRTDSVLVDFFYQTFSYREYLKQSVLRDLRNKYKRSSLGYLWTILHPLAMMIVLATVFSHIMRIPVKDYAIFLFCGLLPWNYFNSTAMMSLGSIRANARLFGQIPVPKYIFVLSIAFSNLVNFFLALIPLVLIMVASGRPLPATMLFFPIAIVPLLAIVMAVSLLLAASSVFFDDTLHLAEVGMSVLYFLSPILYHRELLPPWLTQYLVLNPLFIQIETIRGIFYDGVLPEAWGFAMNALISFTMLLISLYLFKRAEDKFLYYI